MRLSYTVFELLSLISQKLKTSRDRDHTYQLKGQSVILMLKHHMANQCSVTDTHTHTQVSVYG